MPAEPLHIFDPRRNLQLQGFAGRAATTTIHNATETGISISGIFQAAEDFAVLGWWNAYDYYNHLRLKHLPKTDLSGLKLEFDMLKLDTTGFWDTASGYQANYSNTTGYLNTATGYRALYSNSTGFNNTATGSTALYWPPLRRTFSAIRRDLRYGAIARWFAGTGRGSGPDPSVSVRLLHELCQPRGRARPKLGVATINRGDGVGAGGERRNAEAGGASAERHAPSGQRSAVIGKRHGAGG
jgi:hypothetical protein